MNKLQTRDLYQFKAILSHNPEIGQIIAQVLAIDIADYGVDTEAVLYLQVREIDLS